MANHMEDLEQYVNQIGFIYEYLSLNDIANLDDAFSIWLAAAAAAMVQMVSGQDWFEYSEEERDPGLLRELLTPEQADTILTAINDLNRIEPRNRRNPGTSTA